MAPSPLSFANPSTFAFVLSASIFMFLCDQAATAKATFTTFDADLVTGINAASTVTGLNGSNSFVRTVDGAMTTFTVPGASQTDAASINDGNVVAGTYYDSSTWHGFVRAADGTITTFDVPGADETMAQAINNKGEITGYGHFPKYPNRRGFVRAADGTISTFVVPGADETFATAINDKSLIVGAYLVSGVSGVHGFVRAADETFETFDAPVKNHGTWPTSINIKGTVAGFYYLHNTRQSFVRNIDGAITIILSNCHWLEATGINRKGVITGMCNNTGFVRHVDGTIKKFHVPDADYARPVGITNAGVIAGSYGDKKSGMVRGFLRFP